MTAFAASVHISKLNPFQWFTNDIMTHIQLSNDKQQPRTYIFQITLYLYGTKKNDEQHSCYRLNEVKPKYEIDVLAVHPEIKNVNQYSNFISDITLNDTLQNTVL